MPFGVMTGVLRPTLCVPPLAANRRPGWTAPAIPTAIEAALENNSFRREIIEGSLSYSFPFVLVPCWDLGAATSSRRGR